MGVTEEEYNENPPFVNDTLIDAWTDRQEREDKRVALQCYAATLGSGVKKADGTQFTIDDFIPRPPISAELQEEIMQAKFEVMAARSQAAEAAKHHS